ncbi:MAG: hypothetical protein HYV07_27525 [Deltaproteobacteria bacterium]|nr:hypothetical protein [Deltaproteobacteria bacterium]
MKLSTPANKPALERSCAKLSSLRSKVESRTFSRAKPASSSSSSFDVLFGEPESSETRLVYQTLASGQLGDLAAVERALETARSSRGSNPTPFRELEAAERVLSSFRAAVDDHATRWGPDDELAHAMERSGRVVLAVEGVGSRHRGSALRLREAWPWSRACR